jgi:type IV pilus assembly protein PilO
MTFTEEYLTDEERDLEELSNYPTAFGITFTPKVSGIALAIAGLLGSLYLALNWLLPAQQSLQQLQADEMSKQQQVDQAKSGVSNQEFQNVDRQLQQKEALKQQILALFANENDVNTLLLDISQIFQARKVTLISFQPQGSRPTVITDSSLGAAVNNRLKRQSFNVQMKGRYANSQDVLRDLERLQPLVVIKNLSTKIEQGELVATVVTQGKNQARIIPNANQMVTTSFLLDMIIPLTAEELAKLAPPPAAEGQKEQQPPANNPPQ